jgi:hypothetical protein
MGDGVHFGQSGRVKIVGGRAGKQHSRTPRKLPLLEIKLGVQTISNHPEIQYSCGLWAIFRGDQVNIKNSQKLGAIGIQSGSSDYQESPQKPSVHASCGGFAGATIC